MFLNSTTSSSVVCVAVAGQAQWTAEGFLKAYDLLFKPGAQEWWEFTFSDSCLSKASQCLAVPPETGAS